MRPMDQISHLDVYFYLFNIYGLIYLNMRLNITMECQQENSLLHQYENQLILQIQNQLSWIDHHEP